MRAREGVYREVVPCGGSEIVQDRYFIVYAEDLLNGDAYMTIET